MVRVAILYRGPVPRYICQYILYIACAPIYMSIYVIYYIVPTRPYICLIYIERLHYYIYIYICGIYRAPMPTYISIYVVYIEHPRHHIYVYICCKLQCVPTPPSAPYIYIYQPVVRVGEIVFCTKSVKYRHKMDKSFFVEMGPFHIQYEN